MKVAIRNNKGFWGGLTFMVVGAVVVLYAWDYPFGTTLRMGPGYFPVVLGFIMMVFGLAIMLQGLHKPERIQGRPSIRALLILPLSLVIFGVLMEFAGFFPALVALIFVSAAAGREFRFKEVLILSGVMVGMSWIIFIWGLDLPYPMIKFW